MADLPFQHLTNYCKDVRGRGEGGKEAGEQFLVLCQGRSMAADCVLTFRTLATRTGWVDDTLFHNYCFEKGLKLDLQSELACRDPEPEILQIGYTRLSPKEIEHCIHQKLRLYCGQPGHL